MWFTSVEAKDDLCLWATRAKLLRDGGHASKLFPEQMAVFALEASGGCHLRKALLRAKLFSAERRALLKRQDVKSGCTRRLAYAEDPEELNIEMVLYDNQ